MSDDSDAGHWVLSSQKNARQIEKLNTCLQDTNRNLLVLDKHMKQVKEMSKEQAARVEMLKDDLAMNSERLREERWKSAKHPMGFGTEGLVETSMFPRRRHHTMTTPFSGHEARGTESDMEHSRQSRPDVSVRFFDDMDTGRHLHSLHQSIRDLGSGQRHIQDDLDQQRSAAMRIGTRNQKPANFLMATEVDESVAKRLEAMRNERNEEKLRNKQIEIGISSELKQALDRLKHNDSEVRQTAQLSVVKDIQKQLNKAEDEKKLMKQQILQLQLQIQNRTDQERKQKEQEELRQLRTELARSGVVASDYNHLRQELENSERQRMQLSDHVEVIKRELESKEKSERRLLQQLQEAVDEQRDAEGARQQAMASQREIESRFSETSQRLQTVTAEANSLRAELQASSTKNDGLKTQAQETVKLWKQKNQKLEKEVAKFKELYDEMKLKTETTTRELEKVTTREGVSFEKLKRDFKELLILRTQLDEQVHLKDVQLNELVSAKIDLAKDLMDCKSVIERLENELHVANEKVCRINQNRNLLEDELHATQSSKMTADNIVQQLQRELNEVSIAKSEFQAHFSRLNAEKQELMHNFQDLKKRYISTKDDTDSLEQRLTEELNLTASKLESALKELDRLKERDSDKVTELTIRLKKGHAEYSAEVQASKLEIDEQRATIRLQKKQINKCQEENKRLSEALSRSEEENSSHQQELFKIRQQFLSSSYLTEEGLSHGREMELQLLDSKEEFVRQRKNHMTMLQKVAEEVDDLIQVAVGEGSEKIQILTKSSTVDADALFVDLKSKLDLLKAELFERQSKETKMKANLRDAMLHSERDRQILMAEIERQNNQLDRSSPIKIETPSDCLVKPTWQPTSKHQSIDQKQKEVHFAINLPKNFDNEREQIYQRYEKQQEAVNFLKQELSSLKLYPERTEAVESDRPTRDLGMHQTRENHPSSSSAFNDSRKLHPGNSNSREWKPDLNETPPLQLSDDEFCMRFFQHGPPVAAE